MSGISRRLHRFTQMKKDVVMEFNQRESARSAGNNHLLDRWNDIWLLNQSRN